MDIPEDVVEDAVEKSYQLISSRTPYKQPFVKNYLQARYKDFLRQNDPNLENLYKMVFEEKKRINMTYSVVEERLGDLDYGNHPIFEIFGVVLKEEVKDPLRMVFLVASAVVFNKKANFPEKSLDNFISHLEE